MLELDLPSFKPKTNLLQLLLQGDDEEEGKEKLPLVKEEARGRRQPQKQGSAIDLDIGPPLEPNQVHYDI